MVLGFRTGTEGRAESLGAEQQGPPLLLPRILSTLQPVFLPGCTGSLGVLPLQLGGPAAIGTL